MVLFILFPGFGNTEKFWENKIEMKKKKVYLKKLDFLKKLKKIGKVYLYTPKLHNLNYYRTGHNKQYGKVYCNLFSKPTKITLDDINIDKECKKIFNLLKDKNEKFIPIGHSIGSWFALHFSNIYPSYCINTIFLDGTVITPNAVNFSYKNWFKNKKLKLNEITNDKLDILFDKVIKNIKKNRYEFNKNINKYIRKIFDISLFYYYHTMKKELNSKLKIVNISFRTLKFELDKKSCKYKLNNILIKNEDELYKINGDKAIVHYLINATHHQWRIKKYSDFIIKQIKKYLI
jgi:hypothetical protein